MIGSTTLTQKVMEGRATLEGDTTILQQLASTMVQFEPWFQILPGTKAPVATEPKTEVFLDDAAAPENTD